ncbi:hypothetical protein [Gordonia paraffinivorans]|uniref:hypothetical protein n=1 Tax=Gordonia paraffinivorans TaxID=175628 RepID=UPI001E4589F4|nr:hypothetical protein [Gordonia paraffinivorans]MCD2147545.1 hypothetical protein [Gordonia paraffinivorans]
MADSIYHWTLTGFAYTAFRVDADRELVVAYEAELNRLIAESPDCDFTTKVVITTGSKDEPADWKTRYGLSRAELDQAVKEFKTAGAGPHILIVTAKLLTGFDAPHRRRGLLHELGDI